MIKRHDFPFTFTLLIACVIPFEPPGAYSAIPIIGLSLAILAFAKNRTPIPRTAKLLCSLFFIYFAWSLPVSFKTGSLSFLETGLPFLGFPLLISAANITEQRLRKILLCYTAAVIISYIASLGAAIYHYHYTPPRWGRATDFFFHVQFTEGLFDIHPTYYSLMGCIATLFAFYHLTGWRKAITIILLTVFIFMVNARITIAIHTLILLFFISRTLFQKYRWRAVLAVFVIVSGLYVLSGLFSSIYDYPHRKISLNIDSALARSTQPDISDADGGLVVRLAIWRNSLNTIRDRVWFGYGWPGEKAVLRQTAITGKAPAFLVENSKDFNSHNQILSYIVNFGLVGFLLILAYFLLVFRETITKKNWLALSFLIVFFLSSLTESIFERLWGVMLFSFFISVLLLTIHDQCNE